MNITILANRDLASNYAVNLLLPRLAAHRISLFISAKVGASANSKADKLKSLTFFEQDLFNQLISPLLDAAPHKLGSFRSFAQFNNVLCQPVEELNLINSSEGVAKIKKTAPDLIISIRYGVILKGEILTLAKFGVLNLHSGLLPDYRGVMATFWAMLNDEEIIGMTLHNISNSSIDTGDIIATSPLNIDKSKSYLWHILQLYPAGCELLIQTILLIAQGKQPATYSQASGGQYFTFPNENELLEFHHKGFVLVNENEIIDFIKSKYC